MGYVEELIELAHIASENNANTDTITNMLTIRDLTTKHFDLDGVLDTTTDMFGHLAVTANPQQHGIDTDIIKFLYMNREILNEMGITYDVLMNMDLTSFSNLKHQLRTLIENTEET